MDELPEFLHRSRAYSGRYLKVDLEHVRNPAGEEIELELIRHPGASAVVPLLSDRGSDDPQVLMLRQYRYAAQGMIWEIPAGVLDPGEDPETCARRELLEETGATAGTLEHLTTVYTTPGFTDERIHLFLATDLRVSEAQRNADEYIVTESRPLSQILGMIQSGDIQDAKTIVALFFVAGFILGQ